MLSPRSVIFTTEQVTGRQWVGPLGAAGSVVNVVGTTAEIDGGADLILAEALSEDLGVYEALGRAGASTQAVVVLPGFDILRMTKYMSLGAVRAVTVKEYTDGRLLTYIGSKVLWGDIFGVAKVLPWGVQIYSELVSTHEERTHALGSVTHLARSLGLRTKYREAIELVLDELLMNALYDAPVGADGESLYSEVEVKERRGLRAERPAIVQVGCDGTRFVLGVRDSYGTLKRSTILEYLERCARSGGEIERKAGGAGLGLYLVANNVTELIANLLPGTATEIICVFDVQAPRQQLRHLGVYEEPFARHAEEREERGGSRGRGREGATRRSGGKLVPLTLMTAVAVLLMAVFLLIWPQIQGRGMGGMEVVTEPRGSTVYVNGTRRGVAEGRLAVRDLDVGGTYSVVARHVGYGEAGEVVSVTRGKPVLVKLKLVPRKGRLKISSIPSGATIWLDGEETGEKTPALIEGLEPGQSHVVRLERYGFRRLEDQVRPIAEETLLYHANLSLAPKFSLLGVTSEPTGARFLINDVDTGLLTPVEGYVLRYGQRYRLKLLMEGKVPWEQAVVLKEGEHFSLRGKLVPGGGLTVTANVRGRVRVGEVVDQLLPLRERLLPAGTYQVHLEYKNPFLDHSFEVQIEAGKTVRRALAFGWVGTKSKELRVKVAKGQLVPMAALLPGKQEITLVDTTSGEIHKEAVQVLPNKILRLK